MSSTIDLQNLLQKFWIPTVYKNIRLRMNTTRYVFMASSVGRVGLIHDKICKIAR